jgi:hypothetical protein
MSWCGRAHGGPISIAVAYLMYKRGWSAKIVHPSLDWPRRHCDHALHALLRLLLVLGCSKGRHPPIIPR